MKRKCEKCKFSFVTDIYDGLLCSQVEAQELSEQRNGFSSFTSVCMKINNDMSCESFKHKRKWWQKRSKLK